MPKIWFCRTCGYEVPARGRCHACGARLERSPLPELAPADEEDEVGYNLDGWTGEARGRLIVALLDAGVEHRFEDEELVVATDDEERTDDLVAAVQAGVDAGADDGPDIDAGAGGAGGGRESELAAITAALARRASGPADDSDAALLAEVELLRTAAHRLREDPTDMHADGDVAQASAAVFAAGDFFATDPDTWAAVGRVTRRLLAALGSDEALEDEIRGQAAILTKLLDPVFSDNQQLVAGPAAGPEDAAGTAETAYELPGWLPEQRAELSLLFDEQGIPYRWQGGDLMVAAAREADAEALFDLVEGTPGEDGEGGEGDGEDEEARYRALEELFAAADRFVNDPSNKSKATDVVRAVHEADGPTPVGLDDAQWWTLMTKARTLADTLERGGNRETVYDEATTLRDLLRALV